MTQPPDHTTLIIGIQNGDIDKFSDLYDIYVQKIYSFIFHKVMDKETAEDITSDTFMKALNRINTYDATKNMAF